MNVGGVAAQPADFLIRGEAPQPDRLVGAARSKAGPVGAEREAVGVLGGEPRHPELAVGKSASFAFSGSIIPPEKMPRA
jgi:hypothetical protein